MAAWLNFVVETAAKTINENVMSCCQEMMVIKENRSQINTFLEWSKCHGPTFSMEMSAQRARSLGFFLTRASRATMLDSWVLKRAASWRGMVGFTLADLFLIKVPCLNTLSSYSKQVRCGTLMAGLQDGEFIQDVSQKALDAAAAADEMENLFVTLGR